MLGCFDARRIVSYLISTPARPGDVVQEDGQIGRVGDHAEVGEDARLGRLVVVRGHDHDAVGARLFAVLVELDGVRGLVGTAARDDLGAPVDDLLGDLDELDLLGVGQGAGLAGRAGDDDAVGAVRDQVLDVLLDVVPVHLAVGRERGHERDEHLSEGVLWRRHALQAIGSPEPHVAPGDGATERELRPRLLDAHGESVSRHGSAAPVPGHRDVRSGRAPPRHPVRRRDVDAAVRSFDDAVIRQGTDAREPSAGPERGYDVGRNCGAAHSPFRTRTTRPYITAISSC